MKDLSRPQNLNSYFEILVGNSCIAVLSTTSSLEFLSDLELLGGIVLRRERLVSLFCFVGGGLVSFLEISLPSLLLTKVLRIASLYKVFLKWGNAFFKCFL